MTRTLAHATLEDAESRTVRRFVELIEQRLGPELVGVWLYGSRARGEAPHPESDVDLMVVTRSAVDEQDAIDIALFEAAKEEGTNPFVFSTQVVHPEWVDGRRRIRSFFIGEVDRDKIVLHGPP